MKIQILKSWRKAKKVRSTLIVATVAVFGVWILGTNAWATSNNKLSKLVVISGDIALIGAWANSSTDTGGSTYGLYDNYSLFGVSGKYQMNPDWKFGYNYTARIGPLNKRDAVRLSGNRTFVGYLSLANPHFGSLKIGRQLDLYYSMVDGDIYQSSWFFIPGSTPWHVDDAITYKTPTLYGTSIGVQVFNVSKTTGQHATTNYDAAISHTFGRLRLSGGYMYFSQYANGTMYGSSSVSIDQFGRPVNTFGNEILHSIYGINAQIGLEKWNVYGAVDVRNPETGLAQNTAKMYSYMATVTYQFKPKWRGLLGLSYTHQNKSGTHSRLIGLIPTIGVYYIPASSLFFSIEYQHYSKTANINCFDGVWCGTKANGQIAIGATYSFSTAN